MLCLDLLAFVDFLQQQCRLFSSLFLSFVLHSDMYSDGSRGGGGDFVAGFLLGGAVFGTLAYIFAPQVLIFAFSFIKFPANVLKNPVNVLKLTGSVLVLVHMCFGQKK